MTQKKGKLRLLTRSEDILGKHPPLREEVATPEWGEGTGVIVQAMSAAQRIAWQQAGTINVVDQTGRVVRKDVDPNWDSTTTLVICSVVTEDGNPVFTMSQLEALQGELAKPIERIAEVARRLSTLRTEDGEEGQARLKAMATGASPSGSV